MTIVKIPSNTTPTTKDWLKFIRTIKNPFMCEALIVELEAQKAKLNPEFKATSP